MDFFSEIHGDAGGSPRITYVKWRVKEGQNRESEIAIYLTN